jgi:hypothetical protein
MHPLDEASWQSDINLSGVDVAKLAARPELSTVFVHKAVDNERRRIAKRLIGMEFSLEGIRRRHPQADGLKVPPIYPQILCSSLWKSP